METAHVDVYTQTGSALCHLGTGVVYRGEHPKAGLARVLRDTADAIEIQHRINEIFERPAVALPHRHTTGN